MSSNAICRICIEKIKSLRGMYDIFAGEDEEPIFKLIMSCASVQVNLAKI
jgi:hypothetical protein